MKLNIPIILFFLLIHFKLYSQVETYDSQSDNFYTRTIHDFREDFYTELDVSKREFYSCPDTANNLNCKLTRTIFFDVNGRIYSDTSYIDTLISVRLRDFKPQKIIITKVQPTPSLFRYNYKTTVDSLILNTQEKPIKFYENGTLMKVWQYDEIGRLLQFIEKPNSEYGKNEIIYEYLSDTIIEKRFKQSFTEFDSTYNYYIFDKKGWLQKETSRGKSVKYARKGGELLLDSILVEEKYPLSINSEYEYLSDSTVKVTNHLFKMVQLMTVDSSYQVIENQIFNSDSVMIGKHIYKRTPKKIVIDKYNEEGHYCNEIQKLRNITKIESKQISRFDGKHFEEEQYSINGMIIKKVNIINGEIINNLITIDTK